MDINAITNWGLGVMGGTIASFITWLVTRRKYKAEARHTELDNVEKAISIWKQLAEDLNVQLQKVQDKCEQLSNEISGLRTENKELKKQIEKFGKSIDHSK